MWFPRLLQDFWRSHVKKPPSLLPSVFWSWSTPFESNEVYVTSMATTITPNRWSVSQDEMLIDLMTSWKYSSVPRVDRLIFQQLRKSKYQTLGKTVILSAYTVGLFKLQIMWSFTILTKSTICTLQYTWWQEWRSNDEPRCYFCSANPVLPFLKRT